MFWWTKKNNDTISDRQLLKVIDEIMVVGVKFDTNKCIMAAYIAAYYVDDDARGIAAMLRLVMFQMWCVRRALSGALAGVQFHARAMALFDERLRQFVKQCGKDIEYNKTKTAAMYECGFIALDNEFAKDAGGAIESVANNMLFCETGSEWTDDKLIAEILRPSPKSVIIRMFKEVNAILRRRLGVSVDLT